MDGETAEGGDDWQYDPVTTVAGALQRGLGRGTHHALRDGAAPLVLDCLRRDYRWCWLVDDRCLYLARLVRDLDIPLDSVADILSSLSPDDSGNELTQLVGVLDVLARGGPGEAVEILRSYIQHGGGWLTALEIVADTWPRAWWDDLYPAVRDRVADAEVWWAQPPWTVWAGRDDRIAARVRDEQQRPRPPVRPFAETPTDDLLGLLRTPDRRPDWRQAVRELGRRRELALLDVADELPVADVGTALGRAVRHLGPAALPLARRWVASGHQLVWSAFLVVAEHGDTSDGTVLIAALDWLDGRADWCGYNRLVKGLVRMGGPVAVAALPRIRGLWFTPHSYERASYLRALLALDPDGATRMLVEGLTDCEEDVRLLAARRAPLTAFSRRQLSYLRDDPLEVPAVRAAEAARLS